MGVAVAVDMVSVDMRVELGTRLRVEGAKVGTGPLERLGEIVPVRETLPANPPRLFRFRVEFFEDPGASVMYEGTPEIL